MNYDFRGMTRKTTGLSSSTLVLLSIFYFLCSFVSFSQVSTEVDTTKIRIGEQISYKIKVEADSTKLVVFPEGQTFLPLELVEALKIDTTKKAAKFHLLRTYMLTQFDSGSYYIPKQKIIIGDRTFFTDSLKIDVNTIEVDTLKQGLFDIKPIIEVEKSPSKWWLYTLIILLILGVIAFLLYWFIWRKKPLTEEEEIALLPPYERAKLALKKLDESQFLERSELKAYYSELTFVIRKFLDEKVYDRALESTTEELIARLDILKEGNQFALKKETIQNIESILKRADLVKFAKSKPDFELAKFDKQTIDKEIDAVKEILPEPSEEEKLLDQQYKEQQERKKKRRKIILTTAITLALLVATYVGFGLKYGFGYVFDTITGDDSKELLEGTWVKSAYGVPPVYIETPQVLKRDKVAIPESLKEKIKQTAFSFISEKTALKIEVRTTLFNYTEEEQQQLSTDEGKSQELLAASEMYVQKLEKEGAKDIAVKREPFSTPNSAQGLKTFGYFKSDASGDDKNLKYILLLFKAENIRQQILINWEDGDDYAQQTVDRIIASIELNPNASKEETK
jgi:hypothetical protein